jgi:hypothetical protein
MKSRVEQTMYGAQTGDICTPILRKGVGKTLSSFQIGNLHTLICMEGVQKHFIVPEQEIFQVEKD